MTQRRLCPKTLQIRKYGHLEEGTTAAVSGEVSRVVLQKGPRTREHWGRLFPRGHGVCV